MTRRAEREVRRPPIVYCAHTLLANELATYVGFLRKQGLEHDATAPNGWRSRVKRVIDRSGASLDAFVARRADGWLALTQEAARVMRQHSTRPGARIPPPLPDPRHTLDPESPDEIARAHGLEPGGYVLYSGNLDAYQELDLLARAAATLPETERPRIIVATHDRSPRLEAPPTPLETISVRDAAAMRGLLGAARATVVARRAPGGFPIKLANGLAAGTAPIVFHDAEWGLRDGVDCVVAGGRDAVAGLAAALARAGTEPGAMRRIGAEARATWARVHRPDVAAEATLALVERVIEHAGTGGEAP